MDLLQVVLLLCVLATSLGLYRQFLLFRGELRLYIEDRQAQAEGPDKSKTMWDD